MRIKTVNADIYCNNCSYLAIVVDTEKERHIYCEECENYEIVELSTTKECNCG